MGDRGSICEAAPKKKPHLKGNLDEQASRTSSPCEWFVGLGEVRQGERGGRRLPGLDPISEAEHWTWGA